MEHELTEETETSVRVSAFFVCSCSVILQVSAGRFVTQHFFVSYRVIREIRGSLFLPRFMFCTLAKIKIQTVYYESERREKNDCESETRPHGGTAVSTV